MRRFSNFVAGAFLGALLGSVAALLLTPYSGNRLREQASHRLDGLREEMNTAYQARRAQLEAELEALSEGKAS